MLDTVTVSLHSSAESTNLGSYKGLVDASLLEEIRSLSRRLHGIRVCHINATAAGGGVAELLSRLIPVYRALGISAEWRTVHGGTEYFRLTKTIHNALQGARTQLTDDMRRAYRMHNEMSADALQTAADVYIVHDPQPAGIRAMKPQAPGKWVWRCHIDSSQPDRGVWEFLRPLIERYDAAVFTMEQFRPADLKLDRVEFIPPAIDPFGTKNMELPADLCRKVVADAGIDLKRPLLVQVSRFDPWKDPMGVLDSYRKARQARPDLQLAFIGAMAGDDPEGWDILHAMQEAARGDESVHILTNLTGVGSMEVNAFQRAADVVIQKSLREGFGLVVSEALWKSTPVVAGRAGGIPMQFPPGYERFLVKDVDECALRVLNMLDNPADAAEFGRAGREHVRRNFLLPRLIRDELRLIASLVGAQTAAVPARRPSPPPKRRGLRARRKSKRAAAGAAAAALRANLGSP
jgi:trehalose synthase